MTAPRLHGLTRDELAAIGDPDELAAAVLDELGDFYVMFTGDYHELNTDEIVHQYVQARLALREDGPVKQAIKATYDLLLVIIDGGEAPSRSDDEMRHWIDAFRPSRGEPAA